MESHGGYLCRYDDLDVAWLQLVARQALQDDGQPWSDCGLQITVLGGTQVVRFAFDAPFTYGRPGARWYLSKHALARRLSEHLKIAVHAYAFDADELEQVIAYGNGRRVGGEILRYDAVELPEVGEGEDEDEVFERLKQTWPLGRLARVLGIEREQLIRLPRNSTTLLDLTNSQEPRPLWHLFPEPIKERRRQNVFATH